VAFSADPTVGYAPLSVQFTDNSVDPSQRRWNFGDGGMSTDENPAHLYEIGGAFNVYHEALLPDGWHNHTERDMVIVLADTLIFPALVADPGNTIKVPVKLTNTQPLNHFVITVGFAGPPDLDYIGFDTDSCRTDYFADVTVIGGTPETHQLAFGFRPGVDDAHPPLPPGSGRIINLYFVAIGSDGTVVLDTATVGTDSTLLEAGYISYQPCVAAGSVSIGFLCGDADGNSTVNVGDAVFLINYIFKDGPAPEPMEVGDVNLDGTVNVGDAVYLIDYIFKDGPEPCNP
jgi:hypothetical protein